MVVLTDTNVWWKSKDCGRSLKYKIESIPFNDIIMNPSSVD